ncbi:hypothetical protein BLNAU_18419 [Blattamonas nauphoetae]|uniref:Uncharacterized protein n=1 Tax=Blattamonas nauphoetae TaxID=2049346 RepID=A0ABQ9X4G5_9EUKA|nr:hypothetical protein BLNAU_18419 [Blattamonas nauphoetae]
MDTRTQFHSGEFLVARYNCAPSLARFVSALHAPHVPPHDTNNTSLSEQENEKKEKCSNKQKDGKKELEATKLEASKTLKKDKRITRKHRSYGFCLKPTDRDQVDPEVQVRNCSFVACTSVEMFLVGLCLPLDPSSAHFDSVGGRRSNFRRIFFVTCTQLDELFNWLLIRPILLVPHSSQLLSIASISSLANGSSGSPTSARRTYGLAFELSADSVIDTCCDAAIWKKGPIVSIDTFSRVECTRLAKHRS